ncbi:MAG: hypothetical protein QXX91_01560 [Thermoplasmata archaeon]
MIDNDFIMDSLRKELLNPLYIPIIGFGGAGANIIDSVEKILAEIKKGPGGQEYANIFTVQINTKQENLDENLQAASKVLISDKILGLHQDTNGFVEIGEKLMRNNFESIFGLGGVVNFKNADAIILIGAVGGGMGTGGLKETLRYILKNYRNIPVYPIVILPFRIEDRPFWREEVSKLMEIKSNFTTISNDLYIKDKKVNFKDVLEEINKNVALKVMEIVENVMRKRKEIFTEFITNKIFNGKFSEVLNDFELEYAELTK